MEPLCQLLHRLAVHIQLQLIVICLENSLIKMNLVKLYYHAHQFETEQVIFVFIQIPGFFRIDMDDRGTALIKFLDVYTLFQFFYAIPERPLAAVHVITGNIFILHPLYDTLIIGNDEIQFPFLILFHIEVLDTLLFLLNLFQTLHTAPVRLMFISGLGKFFLPNQLFQRLFVIKEIHPHAGKIHILHTFRNNVVEKRLVSIFHIYGSMAYYRVFTFFT